jgi:hypothetical protein
MKSMRARLTLGFGSIAITLGLMGACGKSTSHGGTDSSTHWLQRCDQDTDCGTLSCICGACTLPCEDVAICPNSNLTACAALAKSSCSETASVCVAACNEDRDCGSVRSELRCLNGQCEPTPTPTPGSGGTGGGSNGGGSGGEAGGTGATGGTANEGGSSGSSCDDVPQCEFACPEGTVNPVDSNGCSYTCQCVMPGTAPNTLRMYTTCGDPVCMGYSGPGDLPACGSEQHGDICNIEGARCDLQDGCNGKLVCATSDPQLQPGGCPISRRDYKLDIHYLAQEDLARYQREVLEMKLATWRYKHDPAKTRVGIIIDDDEQSQAVDAARNMVDVYGYTSMAIAAVQIQARQIEALQNEVNRLKESCSAPPASKR